MNTSMRNIRLCLSMVMSFNIVCYPLDQLPPQPVHVEAGFPQMDLEAVVIEEVDLGLLKHRQDFYRRIEYCFLNRLAQYLFPHDDVRIQEALAKYLQELAILRCQVSRLNCRNSTKNYIFQLIDEEVIEARTVANLLEYEALVDHLGGL